MKKVITALLNETVNNKLKEYNNIEVVMGDIQYKEGIIEALEINNEIGYIILSELLPGELEIKELIDKIKKIKNDIKIIIILEKEDKELENYLFSKGDINIFYNNSVKIKEIAELIINKNKEENLELEVQKLKELIMNKKNSVIEEAEIENFNESKILINENEKKEIEVQIEKEFRINKSIFKNIIKVFKKENTIKNSQTIFVTGVPGVGKSVFTVNLSKTLEIQKKKVLIIDFDFLNNSIQTLFGIKNKKVKNSNKNIYELEKIKNFEDNIKYIENIYSNLENKYKIEDLKIKINSYIDLISNINLLFSENETNDLQLLKIIKELKIEYDFIIFDANLNNNYLKNIINEIDKIIFLTEPNILQIKKTKNILLKNIKELKIDKEKIYILFNKVKNDSIGFNILKEVFINQNMIGKISYINNCNILINQNMKWIFLENKIKNQYKKIAKQLSQSNNIKKYYLYKINNN